MLQINTPLIKHLLNTPKDFERWDRYVSQHCDKTIYHETCWKHIFESQFKKKLYYLYSEENENITGILPLVCFNSPLFGQFIISLPFVNYGGVLTSNTQAKEALINAAKVLMQQEQAEFIELRTAKEKEYLLPVKTKKVTYILDLGNDADTMLMNFKAKLRSQIRRPLKEGMYARIESMDGLDNFYSIFSLKMRELGTPVYSQSFFKTIIENLPDNTRIVTVYTKEGIAVGTAFVIYYNNLLEIPWAATLRDYDKLSPNMLLYWEVIKVAIELKCTHFDFGRCTQGSGTWRFKKQWGGNEVQLYWYYILPDGMSKLPEVNPDNPKYRLAIKIWKKLPLILTQILGPKIIRHLP